MPISSKDATVQEQHNDRFSYKPAALFQNECPVANRKTRRWLTYIRTKTIYLCKELCLQCMYSAYIDLSEHCYFNSLDVFSWTKKVVFLERPNNGPSHRPCRFDLISTFSRHLKISAVDIDITQMPRNFVRNEVILYSPRARMCKWALLGWFDRITIVPPDLKNLCWTEDSEFGGPANNDQCHSPARSMTLPMIQIVGLLQLQLNHLCVTVKITRSTTSRKCLPGERLCVVL